MTMHLHQATAPRQRPIILTLLTPANERFT
jgi:hypothetical protein